VADAISRSVAGMVGSLFLHGLLVALVGVYGSRLTARPPEKPPADVWAGETFEVSALEETPPPGAGVPAAPGPTIGEPRAGRSGEAPPASEPPVVEAPAPAPAVPAPRAPVPPPPEDEYPADEGMDVDDALDLSAPEPSGSGASPAAAAKESDERSAESHDPVDDLAARILAYAPRVNAQKDEGAPSPPASPASASAAAVGAAAPFGAEGAPAPRSFPRAFTRAIPAANTTDPVWKRLPIGGAGKLRVGVRIDADGRVGDVDLGKDPSPHLERLVRRTLLALRGGRFELSGATRGEQRLELSVVISDGPIADGPLELGFHAPRPGRPGEAHFQLQSGRRVEITVTLLP
jgi:hypothetical protein